jgi:hypothetical protein
MKEILIVPTHPAFMEEQAPPIPRFEREDYAFRLDLLRERMRADSLSHAVVYADREHFANMDYLIGFEPRFEQALLVVDVQGPLTLLVGNENLSYSNVSPIPMRRVLYQQFSLQGQPRESLRPLRDIFGEAEIGAAASVGVIGFKYVEASYLLGDPDEVFDIPAYILHELKSCGPARVRNVTRYMTGMPDGIRMTLRTAKEVAWAEAMACRASRIVQRILKNLKPGIGELELSGTSGMDFSPTTAFPMLNFGTDHISIGLRSPTDTALKVGDPCGIAYAIRGSLIARVGLAAYGEESLRPEYAGAADGFLKTFWQAIAAWYESLSIGASAGEVYQNVMDLIGGPEFGVTLNPGHYIGGDEWVNSPFAKGATMQFESSVHLQCDIIVSSADPIMTGICEDGVVIADESLRRSVASEYPEVWARVVARQKRMREVLGIAISDDLLPLANLNGVYHPYMLDTGRIFAAR